MTHPTPDLPPTLWQDLRLALFGPTRAEIDRRWRETLNRQEERHRRELEQLGASRNVSWPKPTQRLPDHRVRAAFNVPLQDSLLGATLQELDDALQEAMDQVSLPPSFQVGKDGSAMPLHTSDQRLHLAGGIEHLRLFQKRLLDLQQKAIAQDDEKEEGGEE